MLEEPYKQEKLFEYLISIGFEKNIIEDSSGYSELDLIIFRHNQFYREEVVTFPNCGLNNYNYYRAMKFLDDWGFLTDDGVEEFMNTFVVTL